MKPEYKFKVEKLADKEQIVNGLLNAGYIVSCEKKFMIWEISVYGKERVDGEGHKQTDWFKKSTTPVPYHPPLTPYFDTPDWSKVTCDSVTKVSLQDEKNLDIIKNAIENNHGC